jgi:hypothetical protein
MRRILCVPATCALFGLSLAAVAPAAPSEAGPLGVEAAVAQGGEGGGDVQRLGDRTADLLQDILGPLIVVLVGAGGLYAFFKRDVGVAVTLAAIALFLGLFVFAPKEAEDLIEGFWRQIT